ncbi:uncharacterized protein ISCGN_005781, partial [Ixodes scapularis]
KKSVEEAIHVTEHFCSVTGASLNTEKCNGFWYGSWATTPPFFAGIAWNRGPLKYLGVPLSHIRSSSSYWTSMETSLRRKAEAWKGRDMSMFTGANVCNVFLVSKLMYVLQ